MVAWVDLPSGTAGGQVQYSTYDPMCSRAGCPRLQLSSAGDRARQPALAADDNGGIHAVWMQRNSSSDNYQIFYSKYNGTSWSTAVQVSVNDRGEEGTIEVATDGTLWVVYNNDAAGAGPSEYVFAVKSTDGGATWSATADTLSSGGLLGSSIEVARTALSPGPDGKMIAIWDNNPTALSTSGRETFVNQFDGVNWRGQELVSDSAAAVLEGRLGNRYCAGVIDTGLERICLLQHQPLLLGPSPSRARHAQEDVGRSVVFDSQCGYRISPDGEHAVSLRGGGRERRYPPRVQAGC